MAKLTSMIIMFFLFMNFAMAKTYEVKMLNRGEKGFMVFEPDILQLQPGDSVKFRATNFGHDAVSIPEIWPESVPLVTGQINEEIEISFPQTGVYAIQCRPHFAMGMVMLIRVGNAAMPAIPAKFPRMVQNRLNAAIKTAF